MLANNSVADLIELFDCAKWVFSNQRTNCSGISGVSQLSTSQQAITSDTQNGRLDSMENRYS